MKPEQQGGRREKGKNRKQEEKMGITTSLLRKAGQRNLTAKTSKQISTGEGGTYGQGKEK